ncbi:MAG: hypothetical protein HW399_548 [Dehalococcoidia bacterium]|nr:hypothetical protein [Dehalococcoidia bacterium]
MIVLGLLLLLAISIAVHSLSKRFIPIAVPKGRLKVWIVGWLGGFSASLIEGIIGPWEPAIAGFYLIAAVIGSALSILGWGIAPFVGILFGVNIRKRVKGQVKQKGD